MWMPRQRLDPEPSPEPAARHRSGVREARRQLEWAETQLATVEDLALDPFISRRAGQLRADVRLLRAQLTRPRPWRS